MTQEQNMSNLPMYELTDFSQMSDAEREAAYHSLTSVPMNTGQKVAAQLNTIWARDAAGSLHLLPTSRRKLAGLGLRPGELITARKVGELSRRRPYGDLWAAPARAAQAVYRDARAEMWDWAQHQPTGGQAARQMLDGARQIVGAVWDFIEVAAGLKPAPPPWTWKQCCQHAVRGMKRIVSAIVETPKKIIANILRNPILGILTAPLVVVSQAAKALDGAGMVAEAAVQATLRAWDDLDRLDSPTRTR